MIEAPAAPQIRRRPSIGLSLWRWAACLAAGIGLAGFISVASWMALSDGPLRDPKSVEVNIPAGTAARIAKGEPVSVIPSSLTFVKGDRLVLTNQDSVAHKVGSYSVGPGTALSLPLNNVLSSNLLCSFHPQGSIGLIVRAPTSILMILFPTLVLGIAFGLVAGGVLEVTRRLDA